MAVGAERRAATRWLERRGLPASAADVERVRTHIVRQRRGVLWGVVAGATLAGVLGLVEPIIDGLLVVLPVAAVVALVGTLSGFRRPRGSRVPEGGDPVMPSPPAPLTWIRRLLPLASLGLGALAEVAYLAQTPPDLSVDPLPDFAPALIFFLTGLAFAVTVAIATLGEVAMRWARSRPQMTAGTSPVVEVAVTRSALAIAEAQMVSVSAMFLAPVVVALSWGMDSASRAAVGRSFAVAAVAPALAVWVLAHRGHTLERRAA